MGSVPVQDHWLYCRTMKSRVSAASATAGSPLLARSRSTNNRHGRSTLAMTVPPRQPPPPAPSGDNGPQNPAVWLSPTRQIGVPVAQGSRDDVPSAQAAPSVGLSSSYSSQSIASLLTLSPSMAGGGKPSAAKPAPRGNLRVVVRVRPLHAREVDSGEVPVVSATDDQRGIQVRREGIRAPEAVRLRGVTEQCGCAGFATSFMVSSGPQVAPSDGDGAKTASRVYPYSACFGGTVGQQAFFNDSGVPGLLDYAFEG